MFNLNIYLFFLFFVWNNHSSTILSSITENYFQITGKYWDIILQGGISIVYFALTKQSCSIIRI